VKRTVVDARDRTFARRGDDDVTQEVVLPDELRPARNKHTLQVVKGPRAGEVIVLDAPSMLLGRSNEADIRIADPSLSRVHARFGRDAQGSYVEDMGSRNGTIVEGARIESRRHLHNGEHVGLGNVVLRFALQDASELKASRELYEAAVRDHLTGMHNRGYFDDRVSAEFAYVRRHGEPLALLLLDLDHFKRVNDTYGHPVGDAVLKAASGKIADSLRAEDLAARYGGEEFVVLARGTGVDGAQVLAQRLRTRIGLAQVLTVSGVVQVTCSIGVAVMQRDTMFASPAELVKAADEALYTAKRNGRNQVVVNLAPHVDGGGGTTGGFKSP
jgi:two-component system, cell cycle response regulator